MKVSASKTQDNGNRAIVNNVSYQQGEHESIHFVDNSPQAKSIAQLQAIASNSMNPHHVQLQKIREITSNIPQIKTAGVLGVMQAKSQCTAHDSSRGLEHSPFPITQLFRNVLQLVKPADKSAAQSIIASTGAYHTKGVIGGGKVFGNREGLLPKGVTYTEYDVNAYTGANRGTERLVEGSNGKVYYTNDHYQTFTELS